MKYFIYFHVRKHKSWISVDSIVYIITYSSRQILIHICYMGCLSIFKGIFF